MFALQWSALTGRIDEKKTLSEEIYRSYSESYAIDRKKQSEKEKEELRKERPGKKKTKKSKFGT